MRLLAFATVSMVLVGFGGASADTRDICRVGVQVHLQPGDPDQKYMKQLRAFVENGMADYVFLVAQALTREDRERVVKYLAEHKIHFLMQSPLPISESAANPASKVVYTAEELQRIKAIAGDLFLGLHWGEMDSSGLKPAEYLPREVFEHPTRKKVKEAFVQRVAEHVKKYHDELHVPFAHSSGLLYHGLFAEAGTDVLCSEIGENIPCASMMIASNRGAARAYGRPWMIDHSTWWSPRGNVGEQVSPREGHTPWCLFTTLLGAAIGGADYAQLEVDWAAYDKQWNLLPWGQAMRTLYNVVHRIGPRGETVTRFGILIGHENGWPGVGWRIGDVRGTGLYGGIAHDFMQTRDADLSFKILDVFYPGFERCGWDPEYPGFVAESPLGSSDIVSDNLAASKYGRYGVLVALGYHRMTEALRATLVEYVRQGGVLVCGDTLFLNENEQPEAGVDPEPLIGCSYDPREDRLIRFTQPTGVIEAMPGLAEAKTQSEWQDHWLHPVRLTSGKAVARFKDTPYIVENRIGSGRVYFVTALNMVGNSAQRRGQEPFLFSSTLYQFLHVLGDLYGDGVQFAPWTSLEHILDEKPDGTSMLLVMNHGDMPYRRDAVVRNPRGYERVRVVAQGTWEGAKPGEAVQLTETGKRLAWHFDMPPKSFALFELSKAGQTPG